MDTNELREMVQEWWKKQPTQSNVEVMLRISSKQCVIKVHEHDLLLKDMLLSEPYAGRLFNFFKRTGRHLYKDNSYDFETCRVVEFVEKVDSSALLNRYGFGQTLLTRLNNILDKSGFEQIT